VWDALARRVGGESLAADPRFATIQLRRKNQKEMWRLLTEFASNHAKWDLMKILNEIDVPCGPILGTEDLMNDEHARLREMVVELDHPQRGKWFNVGMPIKLSDSPAEIERSPLLGEHTDEILREVLGYSDAETMTLKEAGAFSKEPPKVKEYHALREAG
jgi:formyl-CoA transferase